MKALRNTNQRNIVLNDVLSRKDHPTADEIYQSVREKHPKISRGTVYRNLKLLSRQGKIRHICVPETADRFDSMIDNHYHFLCEKCKRVFDLNLAYLNNLEEEISDMDGFVLNYHRLVYIGLCPDCAREKDD